MSGTTRFARASAQTPHGSFRLGRAPQPGGAVAAAGSKGSTVGREGKAIHAAAMPLKRRQLLAGGHVPKSNLGLRFRHEPGSHAQRRGERLAVGGQLDPVRLRQFAGG